MTRPKRQKWMVVALLLVPVFLVSCGGGGGGGNGEGVSGSSGTNDFYTLSVDGGGKTTYNESYDPAIECDPRVDWASNQVILFNNNLGGNNWELIVDIMFIDDSVGTYDVTVPADGVQVVYTLNGTTYLANFVQGSGTVTVTRSDTRIEGTFNVTVDDGSSNTVALTGSFGVDSGHTLSCQ